MKFRVQVSIRKGKIRRIVMPPEMAWVKGLISNYVNTRVVGELDYDISLKVKVRETNKIQEVRIESL